jgi:hypothetical protein
MFNFGRDYITLVKVCSFEKLLLSWGLINNTAYFFGLNRFLNH